MLMKNRNRISGGFVLGCKTKGDAANNRSTGDDGGSEEENLSMKSDNNLSLEEGVLTN